MQDKEGADAVAAALDERRIDLGMKWLDVAAAASVSPKTLDRFRNGHRTAETTAKVERALKLPRGYVAALEAGETPPQIMDVPLRPVTDTVAHAQTAHGTGTAGDARVVTDERAELEELRAIAADALNRLRDLEHRLEVAARRQDEQQAK